MHLHNLYLVGEQNDNSCPFWLSPEWLLTNYVLYSLYFINGCLPGIYPWTPHFLLLNQISLPTTAHCHLVDWLFWGNVLPLSYSEQGKKLCKMCLKGSGRSNGCRQFIQVHSNQQCYLADFVYLQDCGRRGRPRSRRAMSTTSLE